MFKDKGAQNISPQTIFIAEIRHGPLTFPRTREPKSTVSFNHQRQCVPIGGWRKLSNPPPQDLELLSDQFGSPKLQLSTSIKVESPKRSFANFTVCRGMLHFPAPKWRYTVKHLMPVPDMEWLNFYPFPKKAHFTRKEFKSTLAWNKSMVTKRMHKKCFVLLKALHTRAGIG